jgi:hypothetical protein
VERVLPLSEAAEAMGITKEALRKRIKRGTVEAAKDAEGNWRVWMPGGDKGKPDGGYESALVQALQEEIAFLRSELQARTEEARRKDTLLAQMQTRLLPEPKQDVLHDSNPWWLFWRR